MPDHNYLANLIWQIADLLRGPYRPPQYERVMPPMTALRRFDCVVKDGRSGMNGRRTEAALETVIVAELLAGGETAALDALSLATEHYLAPLKERRAALIAAAVTGQVDAFRIRESVVLEAKETPC